MKTPFSNSIIERLIAAIKESEEQTIDDLHYDRIGQEESVSSSLATRIQDECNKVFKKSKKYSSWRCWRTILDSKGKNSAEKQYGFDIAITLCDVEGKQIKSVIIQNKMEKAKDKNLGTQVGLMENVAPNGSFVGIIAGDGIYIASSMDVKIVGNNIKEIVHKVNAVQLPEFVREFFKCNIGEVGLDPTKLQYYLPDTNDPIMIPEEFIELRFTNEQL